MKNKFKKASIICNLLSIIIFLALPDKPGFAIAILVIAIVLSIISLIKQEGKKILAILIIIVDLFIMALLLLYTLGNAMLNSTSIYSTISNSEVAKISPSRSSFIQDGNIIEVVFDNDGDDISLSLDGGSKSDTCESPSLTAQDSNGQTLLPISGIIKSGQSFSVKWDCKNDVLAESLYDGNLFFDYLQNGSKRTYQFYMHGWYK